MNDFSDATNRNLVQNIHSDDTAADDELNFEADQPERPVFEIDSTETPVGPEANMGVRLS